MPTGIYRQFKYRLYPNRDQKIVLNQTLGTCRHLYNSALALSVDFGPSGHMDIPCGRSRPDRSV